MIHVIKPGLLTTVQDLGRPGFAHLGLSPGGAADSVSFRIANLLVGNNANAPALEITLLGPTLEFEVTATIAISGCGTSTSLPTNESLEVAAGTTVAVGSLSAGARGYLAIHGGLVVPKVMHSYSTFLPARIGGQQGRALRAGDELVIGKQALCGTCCKFSAAPWTYPRDILTSVRVVRPGDLTAISPTGFHRDRPIEPVGTAARG